MKYTCRFYRKAEDANPIETAILEGTDTEVRAEVGTTCETYGYEAFILEPYKKVWTADEIKGLVQTNDKVLYGALKKLYACQTADEKAGESATHHNGAGFNKNDAPILSSFCRFLNNRGFLTDKQKYVARKRLMKHTKQLTSLANC